MLKVIKPGFYSSIQDLGRSNLKKYGIPQSGSMDQLSAYMANYILGNNRNSAVVEITIIGPELEFHKSANICIAGADLSPSLNGQKLTLNSVYHVKKGDILKFGKRNYGVRSYLAIEGGFASEQVLSSRSMSSAIGMPPKLNAGDKIEYTETSVIGPKKFSQIKPLKEHFQTQELEVYPGPEFKLLTETQINTLVDTRWSVSQNNNRMAYQSNEKLANQLKDIITSMVLPGTVQLTPDGTLIILMRDCQSTGGYPRILQLSDRAINILSQKFTNEPFRFKLINLE